MPYIGVSPSNGVRQTYDYTATAGQTSFSGSDNNSQTLTYTDSAYIDVYQNGILLVPSDYTATTGTTVVLDTGATVNDSVQMVVYDVFSVADTVSKADGGTFEGNVGVGGALSVTGIGTFGGVVTFSQTPIGDFNSHYWVGTKAANQTLARTTTVTITGMTDNEKDSHSAFDGTTFTVPSGGAGLYYIFGTVYFDWGGVGNDGEDQQTLIEHTPSGGSSSIIATGRYNTGATTNNFDMTQTAHVIFQLGVGDTVIMRIYAADNNGGGGGIALADQTNFGGFKIAGV